MRFERNGAAALPQLAALGIELEDAELVEHEPLYSTTRQLMGGINIIGVLKGGLAAALIMNISQYTCWGAVVRATGAAPAATIVIRTAALGVCHGVAVCSDPATVRSGAEDRDLGRSDRVGAVLRVYGDLRRAINRQCRGHHRLDGR